MFAVSLEKNFEGLYIFFLRKKITGWNIKNFKCYKFSKLRETGGGENVGIKEYHRSEVWYYNFVMSIY